MKEFGAKRGIKVHGHLAALGYGKGPYVRTLIA